MLTIIGWLGTIIYLINHAYISINKNWQKNIYYSANAVAAIFFVITSVFTNSWQAVVINLFWAIISLALISGTNLNRIPLTKNFFYAVVLAMLLYFLGQYLFTGYVNIVLLGWISAVVFTSCYLLLSQEKMLPRFYLCWNAFASIIILPQLYQDVNWPVFGLQMIWAIISIYGAIRRFEDAHLL